MVGDVRYVIINAFNLHALDVRYASRDDHAPIVHYHEHDEPSQQWRLQLPNTRQIYTL